MASVLKGRSGNFYNVTMTKNMVKGPQRISVSASPHHDLARIISEYEAVDEPTPALVVLGHHPAFYFGSCAMTPYGNDDYRTVGGYLAEPLRVVPSASLGKEVLIPADAEIVIEGWVLPGLREVQNPFGEISGHYQPPTMYPVIDVQAICFRNNAIMEGNLPAHTEHINLGAISKEGSVFNAIKRVVPEVRAISLPNSGCGRFSCYISVDKKTYRDVQVAGMIAVAEMPNAKIVVVLDEEIDVFNETEVMWAVATQTRWDKDICVIPRVQSFRKWLGDAVIIIDATRPQEVSDFPERNHLPDDIISHVKERFEGSGIFSGYAKSSPSGTLEAKGRRLTMLSGRDLHRLKQPLQ
jgi:UbiD family decarboxylase